MNEKLLKKLEDEKRWVELTLFEHHTIGERPDLLKEMIADRAVKRHDDEKALQMLDLLLLAIEDVHAEALRKEDPPREKLTERQRFHEEAAKADRACTALALWRLTPLCLEAPYHANGLWRDGQDPILLKYKQKLLEIFVQRWQETDSDEEAETLFPGMLEAAKRKDYGGSDLLANAVREMKVHYEHRDRTLRGILRLISETSCDGKDPASTLWVGLARTFTRRELAKVGNVLQHLVAFKVRKDWQHAETDNEPLILATAKAAEAYGKMHEVMCEMRNVLKLNKGSIHSFVPDYPHPSQAHLTIVISSSYSSKGQEENDFHDLATDIRDQARAWLKQREIEKKGTSMVKLIVQWPPVQYAPKGTKPRYERIFDLG